MLTHVAHVGALFARIPFWAMLLYDLLVLAVIAIAVVRRRGFASTLAWIFAIIALPGVGVVAYLLLANPHVARTRRAKRRATREFRQHRGGGERGSGAPPTRLTAAERGM
ncbi:MAG TPA: PLDc N-terminal domain-containing protein, partial [Thermoanaerobaculia bacterium]|nr:PLDc N-terminal domain-containing protein [Thermoanaerobaculia bacterium]